MIESMKLLQQNQQTMINLNPLGIYESLNSAAAAIPDHAKSHKVTRHLKINDPNHHRQSHHRGPNTRHQDVVDASASFRPANCTSFSRNFRKRFTGPEVARKASEVNSRMFPLRFSAAVACLLLAISAVAQVVDRNTLDGKVICGYQGWHACPGDATSPQIGWWHWSSSSFAASPKYDIDMWPDVSEFGAAELFTCPNVTLQDSTPGKLYSAATPASVDRHFQWMQTYGIDGVFLQRFLWDVDPANNIGFKNHNDARLANVRAAANAHGRVFALEYDLSGEPNGTMYTNLTNDWKDLVDNKGILTDPRYLKHNGKPVIAIWGLGFEGRGITTAQAQQIIDFFKSDPTYGNCTVMGGVPGAWRSLTADSETDPAWKAVYQSFDIINPWTVGRYSKYSEVLNWKTNAVIGDKYLCDYNGQKYMPVVWPGYSFDNVTGRVAGTSNIPRRGGDFFWKQIASYRNAGCNMFFVAMFDEVNEGTAIYKISSNVPSDAPSATPPPPYQWITTEGLGNDWYLKLGGALGNVLRGNVTNASTIPVAGWPTGGSAGLVISQVYGGGGLASPQAATYKNDFIELYNAGASTVNFGTTNYSVQCTTATGSLWTRFNLAAGSVAPGKYFLVKITPDGASGAALPSPDADASAAGIDLDSLAGKVALVSGTSTITGAAYPPTLSGGNVLVDYVGYGHAASLPPNGYEGFVGPAESPTTARNDSSFSRTQDTNDNDADLFYGTVRARNSAYTPPINNGIAGGTVHINSAGGVDYTSFATAVADINQCYGGINGNWNIVIDGDLNEAQNLGIACRVASGKLITIKPNTSANPTITFSATAANPNLNAHLFIGLNATTISNDVNMANMGGLVIDGSNNGTNSRNLTLQNTTGAGSNYISSVIRLLGANNGTTIKNCTIKNLCTGTSANDACCIKIDTRSSYIDLLPSNVKIDNCNLQATGSKAGVGIRTDTQGTVTTGTGTGQRGMQLTRNTIAAKSRGMKLSQSAGGVITSNTIAMTQTDGATDMIAIEHSGSSSDSGWTMTIGDNYITTLASAAASNSVGATALALNGAGTGAGGTYVIYNNMIGGFSLSGAATAPVYRGIYFGDANVTASLYQNSINMPSLTGTNANAFAIAFANAAYSGIASLKNNVVRNLQSGGAALYFGNSNTSSVASDQNDLFVTGADTARRAATNYATLAAWQSASTKDTNSISSDPTVAHAPSTGIWTASAAAPNNLHFTADPGSDFTAPVVSGFTWDIDGDVRNVNTRNKGADAVTAVITAVAGWELY